MERNTAFCAFCRTGERVRAIFKGDATRFECAVLSTKFAIDVDARLAVEEEEAPARDQVYPLDG